MKHHRPLMLAVGIAFATLGLAGCDNDDDRMSGPDPEPPPPPPAAVNFTTFVKDQFAATADGTGPVEVDEIEFEFSDDPATYDDLLQ
jgi:hypothetical protein